VQAVRLLYTNSSLHLPRKFADAQKILEQFGGPQGELAAAMRYFSQALAESDPGRKDMLFYLDPDSDALAGFEEELKGWAEGDLKLSTQLDPARSVFGGLLRPYRAFFKR
jgi:hypothetical protein